MRVDEIIAAKGEPVFSFEFFPPKSDEGERNLRGALETLGPLAPDFVSVTYGAGGTTRDRTVAITGRISHETSLLPMAHLTCVGHTTQEIRKVLAALTEAGVHNVLALRGDPPGGPGTEWVSTQDGVEYASDLVALIKSTEDLSVGVAAFPEGHRDALSLEDDVRVLREKYDAGAEFAVTEMVLRASDYFGLVERAAAAGIDFAIIPGLMPITNLNQIRRMAELSGREVPGDTVARISAHEGDPAGIRAEGIAMATELAAELLSRGAPGLHFYTLNRSKATREIYAGLNLRV